MLPTLSPITPQTFQGVALELPRVMGAIAVLSKATAGCTRRTMIYWNLEKRFLACPLYEYEFRCPYCRSEHDPWEALKDMSVVPGYYQVFACTFCDKKMRILVCEVRANPKESPFSDENIEYSETFYLVGRLGRTPGS